MFTKILIAILCGFAAISASATGAIAGAKAGEMCSGIAGIACNAGLWCDPKPGKCNGADIAGTCIKFAEICTREYRPVCGCDNKTYGNDCERRAAKVPLEHEGECGANK